MHSTMKSLLVGLGQVAVVATLVEALFGDYVTLIQSAIVGSVVVGVLHWMAHEALSKLFGAEEQ